MIKYQIKIATVIREKLKKVYFNIDFLKDKQENFIFPTLFFHASQL